MVNARVLIVYFGAMFEPMHAPLSRRQVYVRRQLRFVLAAAGFIALSLAIGTAGYMALAHMRLVDAFLNASMILGGMGPVGDLPNDASKWFASFYALYSGVALLTIVAILLAPTVHRFLHKFHLDEKDARTWK